jgi:hypothetical protein
VSEDLIAAWQACGSDTNDLRDGAHEAHHALDAGLRGPWDRERIHAALVRKARGQRSTLLGYEIDARAVEHLVCVEFDVPHDIDHWSMWACMEAIKTGVPTPTPSMFGDAVRRVMDTPRIRKAAARVMNLTALRSAAARLRGEGK